MVILEVLGDGTRRAFVRRENPAVFLHRGERCRTDEEIARRVLHEAAVLQTEGHVVAWPGFGDQPRLSRTDVHLIGVLAGQSEELLPSKRVARESGDARVHASCMLVFVYAYIS